MSDIPRNTLTPSARFDLCDPQLANRFDNSFVRELPGDPLQLDFPRPVSKACSWG